MVIENMGVDTSNLNLGSVHLGPAWDDFLNKITPENSIRFKDTYNLLTLNEIWGGSSEEGNILEYDEEDTLGLDILNIVINVDYTITEKTFLVRDIFINNIIDRLVKIGITFNEDYISVDHFDVLYDMLDLIYVLYDYEDLQSISLDLEDLDLNTIERYISVLKKVKNTDEMICEDLYYIIEDVSEDLLETLRVSLINEEAIPTTPAFIENRVIKNKTFLLDDTLAGKHVIGGGRLGMSFQSLKNFYDRELTDFQETNGTEYVRNLLSLAIISDIPDENFAEVALEKVTFNLDSIDLHYHCSSLISKLNLG